ncbi:hypothetical protein G7Y79_00008g024370 [Physcia stellaris]|nr:hypothetical protein G7Y79_00008g024370 [Physcia stellaris]
MHVAILPGLVFMLLLVVSGHPTIHKEPATAPNSNLTYNNYSPAGPPDFQMTLLLQTPTRMRLDLCLGLALDVAFDQALHADWNSRIPERTKTWRYHGVEITAQSARGVQNLESRFIHWAIIRMMDIMVHEKSCNTTFVDLKWRGEPVGKLTIINRRFPGHRKASGSPKTISMPESNETRVGVDGSRLEDVEFFGRENSMSEVVMGVLAGVIGVAERVHGNRVAFRGAWDGSPYTVYPIWFSTQRLSQLSKERLLVAMMAAIQYQRVRDDFRCLKGRLVDEDGKYIAEGGYAVNTRHTVPGGSSDTA